MKMNHFIMAGLFSFALFSNQITMAAQTSAVVPQPAHPISSPTSGLSQTQVKQIEKVVHDYLVQNPQVLVEASQAYQDQEAAKAKSKTQQALAKNAKALFNSPNSPTVGNLNGDVTVIEFLDYQCTHCREMSTVIASLIKADSNIRFVIKDLPIFGGSSKFAAKASVAAIKQGPEKYLAFHKGLLEVALPLTDAKVLDVAKAANLNTQQLQTDMKDKANDTQINDNFKLAQDLGLLGTPAFIVANRKGTRFEYVPGTVSVDSLKQSIAKVRK
jgi:protein-disulfide isomerase